MIVSQQMTNKVHCVTTGSASSKELPIEPDGASDEALDASISRFADAVEKRPLNAVSYERREHHMHKQDVDWFLSPIHQCSLYRNR